MNPSEIPFSRSDFTEWYQEYSDRMLTPAAMQIERTLRDFLNRLAETDPRGRVRLGAPRIKSVNRAWLKIQRSHYASLIDALSDIPGVLDDLLGFRMVCTNREDVDFVIGRLAEEFPEHALDVPREYPGYFVAIQSQSVRDYVKEPKPSGYRAYHLNLMTQVGSVRDGWMGVRAELQIRTLLQDAWGELTHEDTYKPDAEVSEFVQTLSLRMAEILVVLDDLAQDLRGELDQTLSESMDTVSLTAGSEAAEPGSDRQTDAVGEQTQSELFAAVAGYVRNRYTALQQPKDLASFAWDLQREFGREITSDWLGFGKMTALLAEILPQGALVTEGPGLLVPEGFEQKEAPVKPRRSPVQLPDGVQEVALRLRQFDSRFPLLSQARLRRAYEVLAESHNAQRGQYDEPDRRYVNMVTRLARDLTSSSEEIGRPDLNYIFNSLLFAHRLDRNLRPNDIAMTYSNFVVERCRHLHVLSTDPDLRTQEMEALHGWLRADLA